MTTLDDLAAAAEKEGPESTLVYRSDLLRLVAVARAAQHQRDTRPGAQPQLVAALAALEE